MNPSGTSIPVHHRQRKSRVKFRGFSAKKQLQQIVCVLYFSKTMEDSSRLNVLYQVASCFSRYDIRDIAIHQLKNEAAWCSTFSFLETSQTKDSAGFRATEAAWCSTFSGLETSQTGDLAGFQ
ncbi:hypothetical protein T265_14720, partial [Opisthorchis viverrini]